MWALSIKPKDIVQKGKFKLSPQTVNGEKFKRTHFPFLRKTANFTEYFLAQKKMNLYPLLTHAFQLKTIDYITFIFQTLAYQQGNNSYNLKFYLCP